MARFIVNEDSSCSLMQRVHADGANIVQSDLSSITYKILNTETGEEEDSGTLTVSDVVYNSLQTDSRWEADDTGYNFKHDLSHSAFPDPNVIYVVEYVFTLTGGNQFLTDPFEIRIRRVRTS